MRSSALVLALCLAGLTAASCHRLVPAGRPPFSITGIVTSIDSTEMTVRHKTGQRVSIALTPGTVVSRRDRPAAIGDVAVGMRIVVLYHFVEGKAVANEVHLFRGPTTSLM